MTKNQVNDLTPEEQAQAPAELLAALESGSVAASAWLASWRHRRSIGEEATAQAEEIRQEVATAIKTAPQEQASLAQWCGFPTDMTRCSPFFPLNRNETGKREYLEEYIITSANWGEIRYTGPKLSTYDEDVLLSLLAILDMNSKYREKSYVLEGYEENKYCEMVHITNDINSIPENYKKFFEPSFTYKGPLLPILRVLHSKRNPTKKDYDHILRSLKRMAVGGLELSISSGKTKSGKRRQPRITQMAAMLGGVFWDDNKKELAVTINPYFYKTYMAGRVTLIDVAKRMKIKGVIAKALYRFVQSQRQNPVFVGHFLTLADALNMDREQPTWKNRQLLKTAINELIRQGILMKKSGFVDTDIIKLERAPDALPQSEKKKFVRD